MREIHAGRVKILRAAPVFLSPPFDFRAKFIKITFGIGGA